MGLTIAKPNRARYYGDVQILDFDDTLSGCPGKITLPVELTSEKVRGVYHVCISKISV